MWGLSNRGIVAMFLVAVCVVTLAGAQITFSRDWTGGKRAAPSDMALDCSQFARLCRHFIHELKTAMAELPAIEGKRRRTDIEDSQSVYDEEK